MAQKPETANAGRMIAVAMLGLDSAAAPSAGVAPGAGRGPVRARHTARATSASRAAATAAVFQSPSEGIRAKPASATPHTAPAVLMA